MGRNILNENLTGRIGENGHEAVRKDDLRSGRCRKTMDCRKVRILQGRLSEKIFHEMYSR